MPDRTEPVYDNRVSAECVTECQVGACNQPRLPGLACGSCCQCLGGCERGWFEQIEEATK